MQASAHTNSVLRRATHLLDTNPLLACEEVKHIVESTTVLRYAMLVQPMTVAADEGLSCDSQLLRDALVAFMSSKAAHVHETHKRARAHNERLGPNYWSHGAYEKGETVDLDDFFFEMCTMCTRRSTRGRCDGDGARHIQGFRGH